MEARAARAHQTLRRRAVTHARWRASRSRRRVEEVVAEFAPRVLPTRTYTHWRLGEVGQLGNQLFQIAATIGIARANLATPIFAGTWQYREFFSLPDEMFGGFLQVARAQNAWPAVATIEPEWRVYLQDVGLWTDVREEVWASLQPSETARAAARASHPDLLAVPHKTAIHVRRGDYLNYEALRACPLSYYHEAVRLAATEFPETRFVVFSDDIAWARANLDVPDAIFPEGNPNWLDLTLMTECQTHICANSTFSWWGAFLSRNTQPFVPHIPGSLPDMTRLRFPGWRLLLAEPD